MIKTQVIWSLNLPLTATQINEIKDKVVAMGYESSEYVMTENLDNMTYTVEREWQNVETAEEWISFIQAYNPVSAIIINE